LESWLGGGGTELGMGIWAKAAEEKTTAAQIKREK